MPYRGGSGKDLLQGFLAGQENRRAWIAQRQAQEAQSAQEALQQEYLTLAKQREARQGERDVRQDALAQAQESRLGMLASMQGRTFEQNQLDRSRERRTESQLDEAMTGTLVGNVYRMLKEYPELAPQAQGASAFAQQLTDPKSKALYAKWVEQSLTQKAQEIDLDRAEEMFNSDLARGAYNGSGGEADERALGAIKLARDGLNLYRESGGKQGLTGKQAVDLRNKIVMESAQNEAIMEARRQDAAELKETFGPQLRGAAREQFFASVNSYARLGKDSGYERDGLDQLGMELANPMQGKQDPREKARMDALVKMASDPMMDQGMIPERLRVLEQQLGLSQQAPQDPKSYAEELKARGVSREEFNRLMKEAFPAGNK